ncbi:APC family permease [Kineococcus gynurae]|uniref:APC family permease n=1 Tax=Kineococcus gynurae TaxID=452979 RepID=A0ABV5LNE2_9ACTN
MSAPLTRRLGLLDAVVLGLGSMIGAGIFVSFGPAASAAGPALLPALLVAAGVAWCNGTSSARLAARYPASGGTYVYGRERLGPFWGYLAGWGFVVGKTASAAAMALTVGLYAWPEQAPVVAVVAVLALTTVSYLGVQKSARLTRVLVTVVLLGLGGFVLLGLLSPGPDRFADGAGGDWSAGGLLQGAALLFFAFAGYARITTLGEEVRDPARTIPRAVSVALLVTVLVYLAVALTLLSILGDDLAGASAPVEAAVRAAGYEALVPAVRGLAAVAALGSLLAVILGISRTVLALARDRHLPSALAAVHPRHGVPHRAELVVGAVVAVVAAVADVRAVIGFSSFAVLVYYAVANASAWTLSAAVRDRVVPALGLLGCLALAVAVPVPSLLGGAAVLAVGAVVFAVRRPLRRRP